MKLRWLLLLLGTSLLLTACGGNVEEQSAIFSLPAYGISLLTPRDWKAQPSTTYDLYVSSANGSVYLGMTALTTDDLAAGKTPGDYFDRQVTATLSQRFLNKARG